MKQFLAFVLIAGLISCTGTIAPASANQDPRFNRPHTGLVCQPMLELIRYLQDNQFKTFIVSGGGQEFMHPWTDGRASICRTTGKSSIHSKTLNKKGGPFPVHLIHTSKIYLLVPKRITPGRSGPGS
jgi:hypothetical protein